VIGSELTTATTKSADRIGSALGWAIAEKQVKKKPTETDEDISQEKLRQKKVLFIVLKTAWL